LELVLGGVGMIQARFLKEFLKVVHGWSCLALAIDCDLHVVFDAGTACLVIDNAVIVDRALLMMLFAPLLAGLNTLLGALDCDARWHFSTADWGRLKLGRLSAGGARGGDIAPSFGGASGAIGRHAERPRPRSAMSTALGHSCHRPHEVETMPPPSTRLIAARVPRVPFGSHALLPVPVACQGPITQALLPLRSLGEKSTGGGGAVLVADGARAIGSTRVLAFVDSSSESSRRSPTPLHTIDSLPPSS
jgi:hypothetical protein